MIRSRGWSRWRQTAAAGTSVALAGAGVFFVATPSASADSPCVDGSTPALLTSVSCTTAGNYTLTVPGGTTDVDVDAIGGGGGAGYPARSHIGGNAAEVTGNLTLPAGTAYLYVIVGDGGGGDNGGSYAGGGSSGLGGGGTAILAEDAGHALLAKLAVAGGGGGGAYNGDGGDAGSPGNSDNAQTVSGPGQPGIGATGGTGGTGTYAPGAAGNSNDPAALAVASGGVGGLLRSGGRGGNGGGGYAGGGGGGASNSGVLNSNVAGGGGGSSLASAYLGSAAISLKAGTGGTQQPGLVAGPGSVGSVTLTFNGLAIPGTPTGVSATPGDGQASVSFTAPSDNGSPITSYTVTASPGGATKTCPGSPCVITGLTDGTSYTFTVHATNANGDSAESSASNAVTPAMVPGSPTGVSATAGAGQASVSFTAPASDGGATITSYTVTASPGGKAATCPGSPCTVTGLTNGTSYTFTVHATNDIGDSPESAASTPATPVSVPGAPSGVTADPGDGQASISFTAPADNGGLPITSYTVTASPGGASATCSASPCVITGLSNGTSYTFTAHATNSQGDSAESSASNAITPASKPGAPTGAVATAGDGQASVSFTAPASDGGASISSYTVTAAPGGVSATCPGSPCTVTGLDNGTSYTFTVHATNDIGDSPESFASAAVTPVGPPAEPTGVTYTAGNQEIGVSFPVPGDGGSAIAGYQYTLDSGQTWSTLNASTAGGKVSGTITGLTNGTTYEVRVRAVNANGTGDASPPQDVTPATVPDAPTGVTAQRGDHSASVSFTVPASTGGAPVTSYTVTASPGGKTATCGYTPCVIDGLDNGTSYTFTVHATNDIGNSPESAASNPVTPATVPSAPGSLTVTRGDSSARLSFTAPSNSGGSAVTGYEYSTDGGATWQSLTTSGNAPVTATVTGLTNGTSYAVEVRAVNSVGSGTATAPVSVTPAATPGAPTGVSAVAGPGRAMVSFTAPADNGGSAVTSYTVTASPGGNSVTCPGSPCEVTGLTDGTGYTFTVHATNGVGSSPESGASDPVTPKSVPGMPTELTAKAADTSITLSFTAPDNGGSPITGYQYSLDGGLTWVTLDTTASGSSVTGTIGALTPGTDYSVLVRAVNSVGAGTATGIEKVTTVPATLAAPVAKAGRASAVVTWPKSDTASVTGYTVYAHPGPATCTTSSATDTSCVIGAVDGVSYTYTVVADSPAGSSAESVESNAIVAAEPAVPSSAPLNAPTTLTTTDGVLSEVRPGQKITVVGTGFLPYSSVSVIVYSSPEVLGDAVTDAKGDFRKEVTVPTDLEAGAHNLVASGVDPSGATRMIRMAVRVPAAAAGSGGTSTGGGSTSTGSGTNPVGGTTSTGSTSTGTTSTGSLAYTGTAALQIAIWAGLLTGAGMVLVALGRRRRETLTEDIQL